MGKKLPFYREMQLVLEPLMDGSIKFLQKNLGEVRNDLLLGKSE